MAQKKFVSPENLKSFWGKVKENILVSPAFTGTPTAPTAAKGTNTTQIATTEFVKTAVDAAVLDGVGSIDLTKYVDKAEYVKGDKKIYFYNGQTKLNFEVDTTDFVKDGMVNEVKIADGTSTNNGKKVLLVTFNTDAGKENIEIPLEGIFNAENYYDKDTIDGKVAPLATKKELEDYVKTEVLDDYSTTEDIEGMLEPYAKTADLDTLVAMTEPEVEAIFSAA